MNSWRRETPDRHLELSISERMERRYEQQTHCDHPRAHRRRPRDVTVVEHRHRVAAPSGPSATEAISRLQANGNRVIVNKVGAGPTDQCTVTSVRPVQTRPAPSGNPLTGVPNLQVGTTVHVGLQC
jgi:hypothetical protein